MALPNGQQYNEAIQHPRICFSDAELKTGTVELLPPLKVVPKPYSGGFTSTYKIETSAGPWAVRCFTKEIGDIKRRYEAISAFQRSNNSPYFVPVEYQESGIMVNGIRHPIIKMKWLQGKSIHSFVESSKTNAATLNKLINELQSLSANLEQKGIAHGDLQHGNILVKDDKLLLIDYDDMYLPALAGMNSNGLGHINYQHPQRTGDIFNNKIDRFSSIVIFLAIKAVAARPALWSRFNNDDNLLFVAEDFRNPEGSQVLTEIAQISTELSTYVQRFKQICAANINSLPCLGEFITGNISLRTATRVAAAPRNQYTIIDAREKTALIQHVGQRVEVIGRISEIREAMTKNSSPYAFLNVGRYRLNSITFTIVIWSQGLARLSTVNLKPDSFEGKWVKIIGVLSAYENRPNLILDSPSQVEILTESAALARLAGMDQLQDPVPEPVQERPRVSERPPPSPPFTSQPVSPRPVVRPTPPPSKSNTSTVPDSPFSSFGRPPSPHSVSSNSRVPTSSSTSASSSATPKVPVPTESSSPSASVTTKSNSNNSNPKPSTPSTLNTKEDNGCFVIGGFALVFGLIGLALIGKPVGFVLGALVGWLIGSLISK